MVPFAFPWQIRPDAHNLVLTVKATFDLVEGQPAKLSEDQGPPCGDLRWDDDEKSSLRYASDFVIRKPKADVLLVGHAYSGDNPGLAVVTLQVGRLQRTLAVFGDRTWGTLGAQSKPAPFDRMPLRWERAMGGPLSDINPVGRGFKTGVMLPNLERREALVSSARDVPPPACFAPIDPEWKVRKSKVGSFGGRWLKERWPFFPEDFDFSYFNSAPPEQQVPYLRGDESYVLHGVRPAKQVLTGTLPGVMPRVFAYMSKDVGGAFGEIALQLDTVWIDADEQKLVLVWRGLVNVRDDEASDVAVLFATTSKVGETLSQPEAFARFVAVGSEAGLWKDPPVPPPADPPVLPIEPSRPAAPIMPATRAQVLAWLEAKTPMQGKDLSGADLTELDLRGADLSGALLMGARLDGAKLQGANLSEAVLTKAHAAGASFDECDLSGADLAWARLVDASFRKAKMADTNLLHADAAGASFQDAEAPGAVFARAILHRSSFEGAKLEKADFTEARADDVKWSKAKLDDARFYGLTGERCAFDEASMKNVRMDEAVLRGADFHAVDAEESVWEGADITGSSLHGAKFSRANFTKAKLDRCVMSTAEGKSTFFRKASLRGASLLKANLMQSNFEGADLTDADLRGANLYQVETWRAKLGGAKLDLAMVAGSKLAR